MTTKIPVGRPTGIKNFQKSVGEFCYFERFRSGLPVLQGYSLLWKTLGDW